MIYVASSWRNPIQVAVCAALKASGLPFYDFKRPDLTIDDWSPGAPEQGFHWSEVMPSYERGSHMKVEPDEYMAAIQHDRAIEGYESDYNAMTKCDKAVLVLPCGKSAHLELGWFVGQNKPTAILLDNPCDPELMYLMADYIAPSLFDLLGWLGVKD